MKRAAPALIVLALALLPLLGMEPRVYLTLTVAGLAMGMLIFLVASGLTLIFGLMDVLNFAHGALFSWGGTAPARPRRCAASSGSSIRRGARSALRARR